MMKSKIRIAHVLYSFGVGGLEGMIAGLINRMDPARFSHSIYLFNDNIASLPKIKAGGVDVHIIKRHFRWDVTTIVRLAIALSRLKPDIVRTYNWSGMDGIVAASLSGVKNIIQSEHGFGLEEIYKQKTRRVLTRRVLLKHCVKIIAVSKSLQRWLIDDVRVDETKLLYIPNGCDTSEFRPGRDVELRRKYGIDDGNVVVGTVGSLITLKGHEYLIRAFARAAKERGNLKLIIAGHGPQRKDLEALCKTLGVKEKIIFAGSVADIAPFYRAMDIFALPSLSENMPNALLQAMATALPIIATDVGDVKDMLGGEKGGIIVNLKDADTIEVGIKYFMDHPDEARAKGAFARKMVEERFNIDTIKDIYETLYRSLTETR